METLCASAPLPFISSLPSSDAVFPEGPDFNMSDLPNDGLSRRAFGQLLGAAALTGALPDVSLGASPSVAEATPVAADDLCDLTAVDLAARIRRKQVSAREVMSAHLARIARVNPKINAVVTLVAERA